MIQFKTLINDWYSKDISKKVRSGSMGKKRKGIIFSCNSSYGYIKDPKNKNHLIIEPERALVVKRIFNMFDNGVSMTEIANKLKMRKYIVLDITIMVIQEVEMIINGEQIA